MPMGGVVVVTRRKKVMAKWKNVTSIHTRVSVSSMLRLGRARKAGLIS